MFVFGSGIETSKGRISSVQFLILLTLARKDEKGTHGYDILKSMKCGFGGRWIPKSGTLYPALDRLVDNGLIEKQEIKQSETVSPPKDRTFRYNITEEGTEIVNEVLKKLPDPFRGIGPFWHYVTEHAPQKFREGFADSMHRRYGLWGRLLAGCVLTGQCGIETTPNRVNEIQWLEAYKQQLQEELEEIKKKLKKLRDEM